MTIFINGTEYSVPSDLYGFTLGQFLEYWERYGRALDEELKELLKDENAKEDQFELEIDVLQHNLREAVAWYSYFTGCDFSTVSGISADELLKEFNIIRGLLRQSETEEAEITKAVEVLSINGEEWLIQNYRVTPASAFSFNELLTAKEITRQIYSIGKGRWDALPYLCAVFLRKRGELFTDELVQEGSERIQFMHALPMAYAIRVAFFLTISVAIWNSILASSNLARTGSPDLQSISNAGAGSIS